jgi:SEC-C motif
VLLGGTSNKPSMAGPGKTIPEMPIREMLDRQITPAKGKEREAAEFIAKLEKAVHVFKYPQGDSIGFELTDALLMPDISKLLGISDAILPTQVPLWLMFPYLRMADLVHTGRICSELGIQAAKVPFGGPSLISAAFGVQIAHEWAEQVASYGISGRFNTDLGLYVMQQPQIIRKILSFRNSQEGQAFRKEVGEALLRETEAEFTTSVNAGLKRNIPYEVLQRGHDKLLSLMTENAMITAVPAVWADRRTSDDATVFWRRKSLKMLLKLCEERGKSKDDNCLCGSGDKLRLCCMRPLKS